MKTLHLSPILSLVALFATIGLVITSTNAQQDSAPVDNAAEAVAEAATEVAESTADAIAETASEAVEEVVEEASETVSEEASAVEVTESAPLDNISEETTAEEVSTDTEAATTVDTTPEEPTPVDTIPATPLVPATPVQPSAWSGLASSTIESFRPIDDTKLEEARSKLASQAVTVERFLNPNSSFGQGWLDYLAWDGIQSQIGSGSAPDLAAANKTLARLRSGAEGVESDTLQNFSDSLERYIAVANFARAKDNQSQIYEKQVTTLTNLLDNADLGNARDSFEVERRLALLSGVGSNELLDSVRSEFGHPNVLIDASSDFIQKVVNRCVNECKPVTDCILGTSIRGTGCTDGLLTVSMRPAYDRALLDFTLSGITNSSTRGVNGPVAIYSNGLTTFSVSKSISLSDEAFYTYPACASAKTRSTTCDIKKIGGGFGAKFIEKIAEKKVSQKRNKADAIASDHAEDRYEDGIDEELDEKIRDARQDYLDKFKKPLARRGASPQSVNYSTTSDSLHVNLTQATNKQLAAPDTAPAGSLDHSLSARVHQSAINNFLAASLGGATLAKEDANGEATMTGKIKPEWMEKDDDEEEEPNEDFKPWEITFRDIRPVSCEITPEGIALTIHTNIITVGDETFKGWDLTAKFAPELVDGQWKLIRQGPVDMLPTSFDPRKGKGLRSQQLALRANLNKAVNEPEDRLPMEIDIHEIDLSESDSQLNSLTLESINLHNGWVSLGWHAE